jgi:hypothetical protein
MLCLIGRRNSEYLIMKDVFLGGDIGMINFGTTKKGLLLYF